MAEPGRRVLAEPRIVQRGFVPLVPRRPELVRCDLVAAACDAPEPAESNLVADRIGQALRRVGSGDRVAVVVDPGLDLAEGERSLVAQDRSGDGAQGPTVHTPGMGLGRRDRCSGHRRWPTAALAGHLGPQAGAVVVATSEGVQALAREHVDGAVDLADAVQQAIPVGVELDPGRPGEPSPPPVGEEERSGDRGSGSRCGCRWRCSRGVAGGEVGVGVIGGVGVFGHGGLGWVRMLLPCASSGAEWTGCAEPGWERPVHPIFPDPSDRERPRRTLSDESAQNPRRGGSDPSARSLRWLRPPGSGCGGQVQLRRSRLGRRPQPDLALVFRPCRWMGRGSVSRRQR